MRKYEIALTLAKRYGYTSYLEICTHTTGRTFERVDKQQFSRRVRIMYRRPPNFWDGESIDLFTGEESGENLYAEVIATGERFDLVFIDPFHTYDSSLRDIEYGLRLAKNDGVVLIHDCSPPNAACAAPDPIEGDWCGLTFAAYLDIVLSSGEFHYCTIDSDFGCGIISKDDRLAQIPVAHCTADIGRQWRMLNMSRRYSFLAQHRSQLLHLVSPDEFRRHLFEKRPV